MATPVHNEWYEQRHTESDKWHGVGHRSMPTSRAIIARTRRGGQASALRWFGSQNTHEGGASGHDGSGVHPAGGVHPGGHAGQVGGGLNRYGVLAICAP